jgi:hypothetical protein
MKWVRAPEENLRGSEGGVRRGTGPVQGTGAAARRHAFWRPATGGGLKRFRCSAKANW